MTAKSRGFLRDNSLSLVFGGLFLATLVGQALAGLADHNADQVAQGLATMSLGEYVTSSTFGVDVMENWQSEYLQFFLYIFARGVVAAARLTGVEAARIRRARIGARAAARRARRGGLTGLGPRRRLAHGGVLPIARAGDGRDPRAVLARPEG